VVKAVLLDMDGTLVRSNDEHAQAWSEALERFGYHVPWADIRSWIGMGGDKILPRVDKRLDDKTKPGSSIARLSRQIFLSIYLPRVKPQPGARALLAFFKSRSLLRVAATSAKRRELDAILQAGEIADGIDLAATSDDAERSKPDADIIERGLSKAGLRRDEAIYIGDTPYDIEGSRRAGVAVIALRCGGWSDADLCDADAIYDSPLDLLRSLEASPMLGMMPP